MDTIVTDVERIATTADAMSPSDGVMATARRALLPVVVTVLARWLVPGLIASGT